VSLRVLSRINAAETETRRVPDGLSVTSRFLPKAEEEPVQDILVVDDDPSFADYMTTLLRREGYRVVCVDSGERALEHLSEHPCRVVITDVLMPNMDGIELLREIGRRGLDVAVIGITGGDQDMNDLVSRLFDAMGAAFVTMKPIEPQKFLARLAHHAGRNGPEPVAQRQEGTSILPFRRP
jgi:DNA-binding response OmpR family regulator